MKKNIFKFIPLCLLSFSLLAQANQPKKSYDLTPPPGWNSFEPNSGCPGESFCFVLNPQQLDRAFVDASDSKNLPKLKVPQQKEPIVFRNTLTILPLGYKVEKDEYVKNFQNKMLMSFKTMEEIKVIQKPKLIVGQPQKFGAYEGYLMEFEMNITKFPIHLLEAIIPGEKNSLLISCALSQTGLEQSRNQCLNALGSLTGL